MNFFDQMNRQNMMGNFKRNIADPNTIQQASMGLLMGRNPQEQIAGGFAGLGQGAAMGRQQRQEQSEQQGKINSTIAALKTQNAPPEVIQMAQSGMMGEAMKWLVHNRQQVKKPNSFQEFEHAQANPAYGDFLKNNKRGTTVNVGKGESKYDETLGKGFADQFLTFQNDGVAAQSALNSLSVMENAMSQPGFYSGTGTESIMQLQKLGQTLGFDNPEGIASMEVFNSRAKSAALDAMGGSLGSGFSNADRDFVIDQVPNLGNSPEGNRALVEVQKKLNLRKLEIAELARAYAQQNGGRIDSGFSGFVAQWAEANPLFPPDEMDKIFPQARTPAASDDIEALIQRNLNPPQQQVY